MPKESLSPPAQVLFRVDLFEQAAETEVSGRRAYAEMSQSLILTETEYYDSLADATKREAEASMAQAEAAKTQANAASAISMAGD